MTDEEIRVRSLYLFLACSRAVDQLAARLAATLPPGETLESAAVERLLKREIGLLFRYWATQQIWEGLESNEADATRLNLAILRMFTEAFRLPRDGSGLRYAELSSLADEIQELGRRMTNSLGKSHPPLVGELGGAILPWRDAVIQYAADALQQPLDRLSASVKELVGRQDG